MNMTANAIRYAMITPLPAIPIAAPVFVMMPAPMVEPIAMKKRSFPLSFLILVLSFFVFGDRCFLFVLAVERAAIFINPFNNRDHRVSHQFSFVNRHVV